MNQPIIPSTKPKIATDIDDTLSGFMPAFIEFFFGRRRTPIPPPEVFETYDFGATLGIPREDIEQGIADFCASGSLDHLGFDPEAAQVLPCLHQRFQIHAVTARFENYRPTTVAWLEKHLPEMIAGIHLCSGHAAKIWKSDICLRHGIKALVEDSPKYARDCAAHGIHVLLMRRPWNRDVESGDFIHPVESWLEVPDILEKILPVSKP